MKRFVTYVTGNSTMLPVAFGEDDRFIADEAEWVVIGVDMMCR